MVNVVVNSDYQFKVNQVALTQAVVNIFQHHKVRGDIEVEVNIIGDRKMHELNHTYRGLNSTTNILTFPLEDLSPHQFHLGLCDFITPPQQNVHLGAIVISYHQALQDAIEAGTSLEAELVFLVEHGTRHLLGLHHD